MAEAESINETAASAAVTPAVPVPPVVPVASAPTTLPGTTGTTGTTVDTDIEAEAEEDGIVGFFDDLIEEVTARQDAVGNEGFMRKMQTGFAATTRAELRDWIYGFLVKSIRLGAGHADVTEKLIERLEDAEDELERQGNLLRSFVSGSILVVAGQLSQLVVQGVELEMQKQLATTILQALAQTPQVTQHAQQGAVAAGEPTGVTTELAAEQ